jgi:pyruvate/2-oxoglutarate dehydrogenase complex dihydrolipoamide acyltransferase (E2) component
VSANQGLVQVSDAFGVRRARAGSILADDGTNYLVKWDDTDEEERVPRAAGVHVAARDSLRFLALSDVRLFHAVFAQEPLAVVLHLLAEASVPLKVREIREHLVELGLRNETWARYGPRALALLPKWPGVVRRQKGDTLAYAWAGEDLPDLPSNPEPEPEPEPERATPTPASRPARAPAKPVAAAATPAEPAVPSAERLRRQMTAARSLSEVARLLTLPREFVAELSPDVVASALRRVAAEDRLVMGWLDALTASGPIGALTEELANARAANAALQSRVDELEEWWTALEQSTDPGAAIRQPGS